MGILSVKLADEKAKGLNVPSYQVARKLEDIKDAFNQFGCMRVVLDVPVYRKSTAVFSINDQDTLDKYIRRYFTSYISEKRLLICIQEQPQDVPRLGVFKYVYNPDGYMFIRIEVGHSVGLYSCNSGEDQNILVVIQDTGIPQYLKDFIITYVMSQGVHGIHECNLYDNSVGINNHPVLYTI